MRTLAALALISILTPSAFALEGYYSRGMNCSRLQSRVRQDGEITILHRIGNMTFYSSPKRCDEFPWPAYAVRGYEPSADNGRCFVGWQCIATGN